MNYFKFLLFLLLTTSCFSQNSVRQKTPSQQELDSLKTKLETIFKKDQTFRRIFVEAEN